MAIAGQVKSFAHAISFRTGLSTAVARSQGWARIIMYHGILGRDRYLLLAQLNYLHRNFRIVPLENVVKTLAAGDSSKHNELVLTFDDGLRNNCTTAYPLLKQLRIPATFFVCPGLVETGKWLWTYEARCRLQSLEEKTLPALARELSTTPQTIEGVLEYMKTLGLNERQAVENRIRQATPGFQPTAEDREAYDVMDWNDLSTLDPELITIGSHTVSHPILPTLTREEIDYEISASRRQLEGKLGRPVKYFCYPNGSHHAQSCAATRQHYDAAVTVEDGMLTKENSTDLHQLPRIAATKDSALMAWRMHRPGA